MSAFKKARNHYMAAQAKKYAKENGLGKYASARQTNERATRLKNYQTVVKQQKAIQRGESK